MAPFCLFIAWLSEEMGLSHCPRAWQHPCFLSSPAVVPAPQPVQGAATGQGLLLPQLTLLGLSAACLAKASKNGLEKGTRTQAGDAWLETRVFNIQRGCRSSRRAVSLSAGHSSPSLPALAQQPFRRWWHETSGSRCRVEVCYDGGLVYGAFA